VITRDEVRAGIQRMADVWPQLRKNDALRREIGETIYRDRARLESGDLENGFAELVKRTPAVAKDGGPAWPPGPREVMECIAMARTARIGRAIRSRESGAPRPVAGRSCSRCRGQVALVPQERVLLCEGCGSVQVHRWHEGVPIIQLTPAEVGTLPYEDQMPGPSAPADDPPERPAEAGAAA